MVCLLKSDCFLFPTFCHYLTIVFFCSLRWVVNEMLSPEEIKGDVGAIVLSAMGSSMQLKDVLIFMKVGLIKKRNILTFSLIFIKEMLVVIN